MAFFIPFRKIVTFIKMYRIEGLNTKIFSLVGRPTTNQKRWGGMVPNLPTSDRFDVNNIIGLPWAMGTEIR